MTIALFMEQLINGLILGSMYALVGSGLALVYGTMRILNFAHGEFYMLGGFFTYFLIVNFGLPPALAIPVAAVGVFLIGAVVQRLTLHYLLRREGWEFSTIAVTLGLSIFLQNLALRLWGERFQSLPYYIEGTLKLGDLRLPYQRLLIVGIAVAVMLAMAMILKYTRFGMAIRATSQDPEAASVLGVPSSRVHMLTFALAAMLGAIAAALLAPLFAVNPWMGTPIILKAFVVVVLGGLGSFSGAIMGGLLLGVVEAIGVTLTSSEWRDVISFTVLILIIWVRPWGLFGAQQR